MHVQPIIFAVDTATETMFLIYYLLILSILVVCLVCAVSRDGFHPGWCRDPECM